MASRGPTSRGRAAWSWSVAVAGRIVVFALIFVLLVALWEGYRWLWMERGWTKPFEASDRTMPHLYDVVAQLFREWPAEGPVLGSTLLDAALFTAKEAVVGFAIGASVGFALGAIIAHFRVLQRGVMPYVVASQTIPILAIAPMVVIGLGSLTVLGHGPIPDWLRVSVIAAYLTFFPVTINTVRGLQSADPLALELMHSYAAGRWRVLWKLRLPTSLPYLFTAFKIAATACVVGAIVGELPSSIQSGLGGAILNFNQYYSAEPKNLWATNIVAAALGISFFLVVVLVEKIVVHRAPERLV